MEQPQFDGNYENLAKIFMKKFPTQNYASSDFDIFCSNNGLINSEGREKFDALLKRLMLDGLNVLDDKMISELDISPPSWLIDSILPEKSVVVIAGRRASFKTFLSLHFLVCVGSGKPVFGKYPTIQCNGLYIDEENGWHLLKPRMTQVKKALDVEQSNLWCCSNQSIKLDEPKNLEQLKKFIKEKEISVVFVDSMRRVMAGDENDASEINKFFMEGARPLVNETGVALVLLHHMRKSNSNGKDTSDEMDELRGSSDIAAFADMIYTTSRPKGIDNKFIFKQLKNRYAQEIPPMMIRVDVDEGVASFTYGGEAKDILAEEVVAEAICKWCVDTSLFQFETKQVLEAMQRENYTATSIKDALLSLVKKGTMKKIRRGFYEYQIFQTKVI